MKSDKFTIDDAISIVKKLPVHHFSERWVHGKCAHHYLDYRSGDYHKEEDDLYLCAYWVDEPDFSKMQPFIVTKRKHKLSIKLVLDRFHNISKNYSFEGEKVKNLIEEYLYPRFGERGNLEKLLGNLGIEKRVISKLKKIRKEKENINSDKQES